MQPASASELGAVYHAGGSREPGSPGPGDAFGFTPMLLGERGIATLLPDEQLQGEEVLPL
jgi:hypothetical protein